ncbi:MAG: hypothetical protein FWD03_02355, partial [Defluviitaleaceae bacterium]|nr:hypothetical protein [Defluviitaleaceae bacterium]
QDTLINFYNHLNKGGRLIIDLEMPTNFTEGETTSSSFPMSADKGILMTSFSEKMDWIAQKISYISRYELIEKGAVTKAELSNFTLYWYGIEEFAMRLALTGFEGIEYEMGYSNAAQTEIITFTAFKGK